MSCLLSPSFAMALVTTPTQGNTALPPQHVFIWRVVDHTPSTIRSPSSSRVGCAKGVASAFGALLPRNILVSTMPNSEMPSANLQSSTPPRMAKDLLQPLLPTTRSCWSRYRSRVWHKTSMSRYWKAQRQFDTHLEMKQAYVLSRQCPNEGHGLLNARVKTEAVHLTHGGPLAKQIRSVERNPTWPGCFG